MDLRTLYIREFRKALEEKFKKETDISDTGKTVIVTVEHTGIGIKLEMESILPEIDIFTASYEAKAYANQIYEELSEVIQ